MADLPSEIVQGFLYLGGERHASDLDSLRDLGITHILNTSVEVPFYFAPDQFVYKKLG